MRTDPRVTVVTDLGFGDAGKGSIVDYLARTDQVTTVVRFNGGSQAGHNVVTPDGRHHTFNQFGSGSFVPNVATHLSRFMLVNPLSLWQEAERLAGVNVSDALDRLTIDRGALVISPYQAAANRLREVARGAGRHGSCGQGIGETMQDWLDHGDKVLTVADMLRPAIALRKLEFVRALKLAQLEEVTRDLPETPQVLADVATLHDLELSAVVAKFYEHFTTQVRVVDGSFLKQLLDTGHVVFEGAQGVLLDEWYGFHPYTTWSTTTNANAQQLLHEQHYGGEVTRLGLVRGYATRHGAGPFVTEDVGMTAALPDPNNPFNAWQETMRVGYFDLVAARYALEVAGAVDGLVITNLDRLVGRDELLVAGGYVYRGSSKADLEHYFDLAANRLIRRIKVGQKGDLDYQGVLTQRLMDCVGCYRCGSQWNIDSVATATSYAEWIAETMGLPLAITSFGPTAADKQLLLPLHK